MIELNNLATLKNVTTDELGSILGGQATGGSSLGGVISAPPADLNNALSIGATGNYLTGQPTVFSAGYQNASGFGINGDTAGNIGLKAPLGNSTSIMGGANLNTGGFSGMVTYKF
jgi:hypothetical protein